MREEERGQGRGERSGRAGGEPHFHSPGMWLRIRITRTENVCPLPPGINSTVARVRLLKLTERREEKFGIVPPFSFFSSGGCLPALLFEHGLAAVHCQISRL